MQYPNGFGEKIFAKYQEAMPLERSVEVAAPSFGLVTRQYGREAMKFWLRYHIANTFAMIGIYDQFSAAQVRAVADDILDDEIYGQFTCAEFLAFLKGFRMGKYGKIYSTNRPNMQEFLMALKPFWAELQNERGRAISQEQQRQLERDREEWSKTAISREQYERMKADGSLANHIPPELWEKVKDIKGDWKTNLEGYATKKET